MVEAVDHIIASLNAHPGATSRLLYYFIGFVTGVFWALSFTKAHFALKRQEDLKDYNSLVEDYNILQAKFLAQDVQKAFQSIKGHIQH